MMLEQEIEKYLSGQTLCNCDSVSYRNIKNLILGFAEPREKRIAELEDLLDQERETRGCIETDLNTRISELEKENAELKARLNAINILTPELQRLSKEKKDQLTKARKVIENLLQSQPTPSSMYEEGDLIDWRESITEEVVFTFETQVQADCAVMALSKGYKVDQRFMSVSAGKPYCVRVFVPSTSVTEISKE